MIKATNRTDELPADSAKFSRKLLHDQVADDLRDRIIKGLLKPGERLAFADLAEGLGVSITPVREAIKLLAAEQLVTLISNRGARVAPVTVENTRNLFEVIAGMEALAAELACNRMTAEDLTELQALHVTMGGHAQDEVRDTYFALNRTIHDRIVTYAQNPILSGQRAMLAQLAERVRFMALQNTSRRDAAMHEHDDLMHAFAAGDSELARRIWRRHLIASGEETTRLLIERDESPLGLRLADAGENFTPSS